MTLLVFNTNCSKMEKNENDGRDYFWKEKAGDKPIKNKSYTGKFDMISVSDELIANVYKSNENRVEVMAPEDLLENIIVKIDNANKLQIYVDDKSDWIKSVSTKKIMVKIYVSEITNIHASGAAEITLKDDFEGKTIELTADSSGSIYCNLNFDSISGNANSSGLITGKFFAKNTALKVSSSGTMKLEGKITQGILRADSAGDLYAENMEIKKVEIVSSSGGDVKVKVSGTVTASANSGASVRLIKIGNPVISKNTDSGGTIAVK